MLMKRLMSAKNRLTTIVFVVSVALGLFLIIAPLVLSVINQSRANTVIQSYQDSAQQTGNRNAEAFALADQYNQAIAGGIRDGEIIAKYKEILDVENGMMGYIEIPRIGIRNPIYHTVEEEVLQHGIGHMPNTSLPVGGLGTHAALSGHRGLPSSKLFTDLDQVKEGDIILIKILDRTLAYKVYEIEVVEPNHEEGLAVVPEKDLLTLVTCTPYAINSHRLLVHAERTEYAEEMAEIKTERTISESDRILLAALGIVALILILDVIVILKRRKREQSEA